jgi:hypothetical protein
MGVTLAEIAGVFSSGNVRKAEGLKLLDIGSSNIYGGTAADFEEFISTYSSISADPALKEFCGLMSLGAMRHPIAGGLNGAWLGELLERMGCEYAAYDIFEGYMTTLFDLNRSAVPPIHRGYFDVAINCGTTEHVLNQLNSFRVIHDAVRIGGLMYHSLPMVGYLDHGYFNYNPRLFIEIAQANEYEIITLNYSDPQNAPQFAAKLVEPYLNYGIRDARAIRAAWRSTSIPDAGLGILLRKHLKGPFRAPFETSTTVGGLASVPFNIQRHSEKTGLASQAQAIIDDVENTPIEGIVALLAEFQRENMLHAFPPALERRLLAQFPIDDPTKHEQRIRQLDHLETLATPLVRVPENPAGASIAMDGVESDVASIQDDAMRYHTIVHAYKRYVAAGRADEFPLELEKEALQKAIEELPNDYDLVARLGKVVAALIARTPLYRPPRHEEPHPC